MLFKAGEESIHLRSFSDCKGSDTDWTLLAPGRAH
jgi:hypothetical protein